MRQVLDALRYCHSKNIVHGDLRPHHLLLANRENSAPVKISGFSSAAELDQMGNVSEGSDDMCLLLAYGCVACYNGLLVTCRTAVHEVTGLNPNVGSLRVCHKKHCTSLCRGHVNELVTEPFLLLHREHGTGCRWS